MRVQHIALPRDTEIGVCEYRKHWFLHSRQLDDVYGGQLSIMPAVAQVDTEIIWNGLKRNLQAMTDFNRDSANPLIKPDAIDALGKYVSAYERGDTVELLIFPTSSAEYTRPIALVKLWKFDSESTKYAIHNLENLKGIPCKKE